MSTTAPQTITITQPDDWHIHLRQGAMLQTVLPHTTRIFARAIVMPNLRPPVVTTSQAETYRKEIMAAVPNGHEFIPLMTLYLADDTDAQDLANGHKAGIVTAVKLYPAHATTNSEHGVTDLRKIGKVLEMMQAQGIPLLVHGEVTDPDVDVFDREAIFIDKILIGLMHEFPQLKIVLEHITTRQGAAFVRSYGSTGRIAATITAHHLLINRNALFQGGLRPHYYCLPVAKREQDRLALLDAATSGEPWFFLGTDSAPHLTSAKESACACAGIYTAPYALELYAEAFEQTGKLDQLEAFASLNGPRFYGLPVNTRQVRLTSQQKRPEIKPLHISSGEQVEIFTTGRITSWNACLL